MAVSKLLILSIFLALIFTEIRADAAIEEEVLSSDVSDSSIKIELEQLKSKISVLGASIDERTRELKSKNEIIAQMEKIIQEKSDSIASLQKEIKSFQKKGTMDAEERVVKALAHAEELEKQVDILKKKIEAQNRKEDALEARAIEAEKKMLELDLKVENLQKINDEQKSRIRKTERALQVAEEEIMQAKLETTSKTKELMEAAILMDLESVTHDQVHGAWLPPWLAIHLLHCQSFTATHWNEHGKPALDIAVEKALEMKVQAEKWAEPHMETVKTKWIPVLKEKWLTFTTYVEPRVQSLATKTVEVYEASRTAIAPHIVKVQELADPYFLEAKKFTKPYIDQVATVTKPHVDKARVALKPYTKKLVHAYGKFLKSATTYHHQVQAAVLEKLKQHELTRPLATKELVWFAASALLALPIFILSNMCSAIFCKKAKKPTRNAHTNHTRRRAKRGYPDK
ncbi:hypothetical protein HHK36_026149 [Tetracentron sinense]|uniref:Uncharacterized protein n=1 Tax=Tetracentron sinense TaxID=13715 RepID=A0A834YIN4_TETSI|nr:hypothetical protein HHK36_026149 [Tetracentron sinense]